jgi:hypothetical protein
MKPRSATNRHALVPPLGLFLLGFGLLLVGCEESPAGRPGFDFALGEGLPATDGQGSGDGGSQLGDVGIPDQSTIDPSVDTDGDGLPDGFEKLYGLDPQKKDTDGDGVLDGDEDEDKDGLTNAVEWAAWQTTRTEGQKPSPKHKDLLVELDYQAGYGPSSTNLSEAIEAYAAVDVSNPDGTQGIALHVYIDEKDLTVASMSETLTDRLTYLGAHGPKASGSTGKHFAKMVHVMFVSERPGSASRGGDTVASDSESAEKAGVLVYVGNLKKLFPTCTQPNPPAVSVEEAVTSTFVHEVGHTLQLGHDTTTGGGINAYNIMATDLGTCTLLKERTRGTGNTDASLGATESKGGPRFSTAAAALIKLTNKISVETNQFEVTDGYAM